MTANSFVKNAWYVAGMTPEFETNQLHGTIIVKKPVVMWRTSEGKVVAFDDRCVHKKMPLSCGKPDDYFLMPAEDVPETGVKVLATSADGVGWSGLTRLPLPAGNAALNRWLTEDVHVGMAGVVDRGLKPTSTVAASLRDARSPVA